MARRHAVWLLFVVFFLSGASALVYQTAWHRLLGLFSGSDSLSSAIVVGAFLLGIGLGSLVAGLWADRLARRSALIAFALCEIAIGAYATATPWLFHDVMFGRFVLLAESRLIAFALAFAGLVLPTFLMGLSLPLLSRAVVTAIEEAARDIAQLYFVNTLGAGVGAIVAGWWLIGHVGYDGAIRVGAAANFAVGIGALLAARWTETGAPAASTARVSPDAGDENRLKLWCVLVFASGFVSVSLQIVWYRLVGVLLQGNAYAFSSVLGLLLIADAIGMVWGARMVTRLADPHPVFLRVQAAVVLSAVAAAWLLHGLFGFPGFAAHFADHDVLDLEPGDLAALLSATFLLVVPSSLLIGLTFPLAQCAVQDDAARVGRRVGWIQLFNIAGNCAGSLGTGLLLLHWLGTAGTLRLVAVIGLVFLLPLALTPRRRPVALALGLVVVGLGFPSGDAFWRALHRVEPGMTAIIGEDRTGVVLLRQDAQGPAKLFIQGHTQSEVPFLHIHAVLGSIGALTHPDPRDILVIGSGSGGTPFAAGVNPATRHVRTVEIVAPVYDVLQRFAGTEAGVPIRHVLADRRHDWVVGDGRRDLFVGGARYDIIQADAILPKTSHSGLLYSAEFFREVRAHLKPGGIAVQWMPTDRVRRTFASVFPQVLEIHPALLGSDQPIPFDRDRLRARLQEPAIAERLIAGAVPPEVLARWFERAQVKTVTAGATAEAIDINTDLFPQDEYYLNRRARRLAAPGRRGLKGPWKPERQRDPLPHRLRRPQGPDHRRPGLHRLQPRP
ncbi:MAG: spermidine synthase [Alphaproteobacteria bacterium]|nr:spermidine synthase [Alphaproteobacteria bacterium]